jgi:hypothetical protein
MVSISRSAPARVWRKQTLFCTRVRLIVLTSIRGACTSGVVGIYDCHNDAVHKLTVYDAGGAK